MHIINPLFISLIAFALVVVVVVFLWKICYNFCVGAQTINKLISLRFIAGRSQMFCSFCRFKCEKIVVCLFICNMQRRQSMCECACVCV